MKQLTPRKKAKLKGEITYLTGIPCVNGHICEKYTQNGECHDCALARSRDPKRRQRQTETDKKWRKSKSGKASILKYKKSKVGVAARKRYKHGPSGRAAATRYSHSRRAKLLGRKYVPYSGEDLIKRFKLFQNKCAYCGKKRKLTTDHFIPLSKGGVHILENIVPACSKCNNSKNAQNAETWYKSQKFYSVYRWKRILRLIK